LLDDALAAGDTLWFTTDGHMCLDTPTCAIERLLPWLCWKYGVAAYEFWGVNWWTYDPWERGWHTFISQSDDGARYYYVRYPNGDGYLAYPGEPVGQAGPVPSIRTEQAYTDWVKRFILFHHKKHPRDMGGAEVEQFLTHLAVAGRVAASTQNQALSALLFLYKEVLKMELPWLEDMKRAKKPQRLPVVLTVEEVKRVLARMDGQHGLMADLLYGAGLRLLECGQHPEEKNPPRFYHGDVLHERNRFRGMFGLWRVCKDLSG